MRHERYGLGHSGGSVRFALITPDGSRLLARAVIHDGRSHQATARAATSLKLTGDASLGMAIMAAPTWRGAAEPFHRTDGRPRWVSTLNSSAPYLP